MSRSADTAVGMMDAAYFVGRKELLDFFNELLDLSLTKIEQTASGAIACQLTELIFPGSIPLTKINWEARSDYEFVQNYKLLQNAFNKHNVQRFVDVDKLIRAKYQDNLEFTQWLKAFYDQSGVYREDYDPRAVRARGKGGKKYNETMSSGAGRLPASKGPTRPSPRNVAPSPRMTTAASARAKATAAAAASSNSSVSSAGGVNRGNRPLRERPATNESKAEAASSSVSPDPELLKMNAELTGKVEDLEQAVLDIEKERDFYFDKLRQVEIMCQVHQEKGSESDPDHLVEKILKVLYATADETIIVDDDGELVDGSQMTPEELAEAVE